MPSAVQAQAIVVGPLAATTAAPIPVDHPLALLLLVVGMGASLYWGIRKGLISPTALRSWWVGAAVLVSGGMAFWGDEVRAQLQGLQLVFNQPGGQTVNIPVSATSTTADGSPLGFEPVVFTNQTSTALRVTSITKPAWNTCFPLGIPSSPPSTPALTVTACAVGTQLDPGAACWVDVAQICADAASDTRGSHASVLEADTATATAGVLLTGNVLSNDSDADGPLQVASYVVSGFSGNAVPQGTLTTLVGWGSFAVQASGAFTFTPATPFTATNPVLVTYKTQTGATSTLTITVNPPPANWPPVAVADQITVAEGGTTTTLTGGATSVLANDTDAEGGAMTAVLVTGPAHGTLTLNANGTFSYTHDGSETTSDSFSYKAREGSADSNVVTVSITITPVNDAPVAVPDTYFTAIDTPVSITLADLLANDTDAEGDSLTVVSASSVVNGSLSFIGGKLVLTPDNGFEGTASFTYTIRDVTATATATATVTVHVGSP